MAAVAKKCDIPTQVSTAIWQSRASIAAQRRQDRRYRDERAYVDGETECLAQNLRNNNSVADAFDALEIQARVKRALAGLSVTQRRRVELHYYMGYTNREIAHAEGVSPQAVSYSIKKSLIALRKILQEP